MSELYIYHHLGLGDHIICNAIIRNYYKLHDKIYLFVKPHNLESVSFMYRDLDNIEFIQGCDQDAERIIMNKINVLRVGFNKLDVKNYKFDKSFYMGVDLDFEKRWSDFYVQRDINGENNLFNTFGVTENNYVLIHDDINRTYEIDDNEVVNKNIPIIRPNRTLTNNIFDYCYLIENAKELHCIDSTFKLIADSINIKTDFLFYHLNRRQDYNYYSSSKYDWMEV